MNEHSQGKEPHDTGDEETKVRLEHGWRQQQTPAARDYGVVEATVEAPTAWLAALGAMVQ